MDEQAVVPVTGVPRLLHSDPHDFAGLYVRHRSSFTLHARRYLRDQRDADEVVQEAFLRLFLALPELETELQALAYCRRTITNLCIDRYRAQARRPSLVDLDSVPPDLLPDEEPLDPVVRAEDAALVREALSLLSPLHRAALVKREIEEKTVPVIAAELDIPEESVKHLLFRARRALRRILEATSLAPGTDAELGKALGKVAKAGSGGVAAFLAFLALTLSAGPDLRSIPVVGADLPDILPVSEIATGMARAVGNAVHEVADKAVSAVGGGQAVPAKGPSEPVDGPAAVPAPSPSSAAPTPDAEPLPAAAPSPLPSLLPSPAAVLPPRAPSPSAEPEPSEEPSVEPSAEPSPSGSAEPSPSGSPEPSADPSASPDPEASAEPSAAAVGVADAGRDAVQGPRAGAADRDGVPGRRPSRTPPASGASPSGPLARRRGRPWPRPGAGPGCRPAGPPRRALRRRGSAPPAARRSAGRGSPAGGRCSRP